VLSAGLPIMLIFLNGPATLAIDQTLNQLAKEYVGQLLIVKVLVNDSPLQLSAIILVEHLPWLRCAMVNH